MATEPEDDDSWLYGEDSSANAKDEAAAESTDSRPAPVVHQESVSLEDKSEVFPAASVPVRKASRDSLPGDSEGSVGDGNQEEAQEAEEGDDDSELDSEDDSDDDIKVTIRDIQASTFVNPASAVLQRAARTSVTGISALTRTDSAPSAPVKGVDVEAVGKINGVPTYEFDLDSVDDKPWRKPGAEITDYFNYGFTEDTWKAYCEKQRRLRLDNVPTTLPKKYDTRDVHPTNGAHRAMHGSVQYAHMQEDDQDGRNTPEEGSIPSMPSAADVAQKLAPEQQKILLPNPAPPVPVMPAVSVGAPPFLPPQLAALGFHPPGALLRGAPRQPPPFGLPPPLPGMPAGVPRLPLPAGLPRHPPPLHGLPPFDGRLPLPPGLPPKLPAHVRPPPDTGSDARADLPPPPERPALFPADGSLFSGAEGIRPPPGFEAAFTGDMSLGEAFAALARRPMPANRSRSPSPFDNGRSPSQSRAHSQSRSPSPASGAEDGRRYDRHYRDARRQDRGGDYHRHHRSDYADGRDGRDRREYREHESRRRHHEREQRERRDDKERDRHRDRDRYEREERDRRDRRDEDRVREDRDREERSRHERHEKEEKDREHEERGRDERERRERSEQRERSDRVERDSGKRDDDKRRDRKRRRSGSPTEEQQQQPRRHKRQKASKEKAG